jgi:hypothetical protein
MICAGQSGCFRFQIDVYTKSCPVLMKINYFFEMHMSALPTNMVSTSFSIALPRRDSLMLLSRRAVLYLAY